MRFAYGPLTAKVLAVLLLLVALLPPLAGAESGPSVIREWEAQWISEDSPADGSSPASGNWIAGGVDHPVTAKPKGARGIRIRFAAPPTSGWQRPGLLVDRLYGLDLAVYQNGRLLYEADREFAFDLNKLLVPIEPTSEPSSFEIRILTSGDRAGLLGAVRVGDIDELSGRFVSKDMPDLLLGTAIVFLALIMLLCSRYLHRKQRSSWVSLCLIALTMGMLILTYSPLPYIYFKEFGELLLVLFDLSLFVLIPAFSYYIDQIFERQFPVFTKFRRWQTGYSALCIAALFVYKASGEQYYEFYYILLNVIMSALIVLQLLLVVVLSTLHALKGNRNAVFLSAGILSFAVLGITDLALYYFSRKTYVLFLWKIGFVVLVAFLVVILARRVSADYAKLVNYSRELELYNHNLQRTEKMQIISDLAASVAHEVRNPLQVTRGFLQLLAGRSDEASKPYFDLAAKELDRAADIITDFLTFAKPEIDGLHLLDMSKELRNIEAMITPLASMHGGVLHVDVQEGLYFLGNSSKLKQALINIVKNSIEAIGADGRIAILGTAEQGDVVVRIADNGVGMDEEQMAKLGIPFFSTKSKGTGLGLMVTFRIIEVMKGTIHFVSAKGKGTEVTIRFPLANNNETLPDEVPV
ncbi:hypothetical protein J19TS2_37050 [Cohnella xylanilytica]|uniref:histidine kinase n=1 Tax=Cohnella xylanilytica TaxID=557555 RepID=A0A841U6W9_9BACL|nr:HAMP domain-containing sensor histidine kinase [Cohnella xylanilytica]MBB6693804.1 HAMP domain-containing histidine kinase [Cohnella xylanilytica]GIO14150.1 hypothetical protein J19TS2_37050 [Cohnella xylanilytica]